MRFNRYGTGMLSKEAKEKLPGILDEMGYAGRYEMGLDSIMINSTRPTVEKAFHLAEAAAKGEDGYLIHVRKVSYGEIWVPKTKATSLNDAYKTAFRQIKDEFPTEGGTEYGVASAEDSSVCSAGSLFHEEWEIR